MNLPAAFVGVHFGLVACTLILLAMSIWHWRRGEDEDAVALVTPAFFAAALGLGCAIAAVVVAS